MIQGQINGKQTRDALLAEQQELYDGSAALVQGSMAGKRDRDAASQELSDYHNAGAAAVQIRSCLRAGW